MSFASRTLMAVLALLLFQLTVTAPAPHINIPTLIFSIDGTHTVDLRGDATPTLTLPFDSTQTLDLAVPTLTLSIDGTHTLEPRDDSAPTSTIWNGGRDDGSTTSFALPDGGQHWMDESIPVLTLTPMDRRDTMPTPAMLQVPSQYITAYITTSFPVASICPGGPATKHLPPEPSLHSRPMPQLSKSASAILPRQQQQQFPTNEDLTCIISYTTTLIPRCHTTLSPLAAPEIPITDCEQLVTFSSEYGYRLPSISTDGTATAAARSAIETTTTFYVAPWYDLQPGVVPSVAVGKVVEPSQLSNSLGVIESTAIATNGGEGVAAMKGGKGGQEALLSTGATNVFINSFTSAITVVVISESASGMTSVRV